MARIDGWLNGRGLVDGWLTRTHRSSTVGNMITDKPFAIVINRTNIDTQVTTQLAAQTVRLDLLSGSVQEQSLIAGLGTTSKQRVLIVGYKDHPTENDLNIQLKDTFPYEGQFFVVVKIEPTFTDRTLAVAEADG